MSGIKKKINTLDNAIAPVRMEDFVFTDGEKELCMVALVEKSQKIDL